VSPLDLTNSRISSGFFTFMANALQCSADGFLRDKKKSHELEQENEFVPQSDCWGVRSLLSSVGVKCLSVVRCKVQYTVKKDKQ
jgi:hypothetical protein